MGRSSSSSRKELCAARNVVVLAVTPFNDSLTTAEGLSTSIRGVDFDLSKNASARFLFVKSRLVQRPGDERSAVHQK